MKKRIISMFIILLFSLNNVSAYDYPNVTNLLKNFYVKLDESNIQTQEKISKLEKIKEKIIYIQSLEFYKSSNYNKGILKLIEASISNKIVYYDNKNLLYIVYNKALKSNPSRSFSWFIDKNNKKGKFNFEFYIPTLEFDNIVIEWTNNWIKKEVFSWSADQIHLVDLLWSSRYYLSWRENIDFGLNKYVFKIYLKNILVEKQEYSYVVNWCKWKNYSLKQLFPKWNKRMHIDSLEFFKNNMYYVISEKPEGVDDYHFSNKKSHLTLGEISCDTWIKTLLFSKMWPMNIIDNISWSPDTVYNEIKTNWLHDNKLFFSTNEEWWKYVEDSNYLYDFWLRKYMKTNIKFPKPYILMKDLWKWFKFSQTLDNTFLYYNWFKVYSWSHISKKLPFIWDEWCDMLSEKFYKIWNNINAKIKQNTWDSLWEENRKKCLRKNYYNTLSISKINDRFFTINKAWYEWKSKIIFDNYDNKVIERIKAPLDTINRIESGKSWIYILYHGDRWNSWGLIFIDKITNKVRILFSNTDLEISNIDYKDIIEFELMINRQIKIFYKWQNLEKKELIINI